MATTEKFCLKWNDFEANIGVAFRELREDKDFFDVTLACEDAQIEAHKVILASCSPFFRNILRKNPHSHPLLYMKGVTQRELKAILDFMYHGEVQVAQEDLNSFLAVAEELKVKGLTQNKSTADEKSARGSFKPQSLPPPTSFPPPTPMQVTPAKRDEGPTFAHHLPGEALRMDEQSNPVKTEPGEDPGIHNSDSALLLYQDFDEDTNGDDHSHNYPDFRGKHQLIWEIEML